MGQKITFQLSVVIQPFIPKLCGLKQRLSSAQFNHSVQVFATSGTEARQASMSITSSHSLLKLMSIEQVMTSNHFILCPPRLLPSSIIPSIRVFSNESVLHITWPKYWSFSFSISPSDEYSGLFIFLCNGLSQFWEFRAVAGVPGTGKIHIILAPDHSSSFALAPPSLYTQPLQTFQTYNGTQSMLEVGQGYFTEGY